MRVQALDIATETSHTDLLVQFPSAFASPPIPNRHALSLQDTGVSLENASCRMHPHCRPTALLIRIRRHVNEFDIVLWVRFIMRPEVVEPSLPGRRHRSVEMRDEGFEVLIHQSFEIMVSELSGGDEGPKMKNLCGQVPSCRGRAFGLAREIGRCWV